MIRPVLKARSEQASDQRTYREILNIDPDNDPYDRSTPEERALRAEREAKGKQAYADAHKKGGLSGESFSAGSDAKATITDIRASVGDDGRVQIDSVIATKGLHDLTAEQKREHNIAEAEAEAAGNQDWYQPETGDRQSRRGESYVAACIDRDQDSPLVVVVPRLVWFKEERLDPRVYGDALAEVLPPADFPESPPGGVFRSALEFEKLIDHLGSKGFLLSIKLQRFYRATVLGEDITWKDETEKPPEDPNRNLDENGDDLMINPEPSNYDYFKTEIVGAKTEQMDALLAEAGVRRRAIYLKRDSTAGCWYVCTVLRLSGFVEEAALRAGFAFETFQVDRRGDRLVAKQAGVTPVDRNAVDEEKPRPWNDMRATWEALSDEDKEKDRKTWKGNEFLVTGSDIHDRGLTVWICPESWFRKHGTMYPDRLDIAHLLPEYMEEVAPWTFRSTDPDKDWNTVSFAIENKQQMRNSPLLALHLNSLDS